MPKSKLVEYGGEYNDIRKHLEERLNAIAGVYNLSWKTPPHDIARWIINEIVELEEVEI